MKSLREYILFSPFYIISLLPYTCIYLLSDMAFIFLYYIWKYRRNVVKENVRQSFPNISTKEYTHIEKGFYRHFCDVAFETIKLLTINKVSIKHRLHVKNIDIIDAYYTKENKHIMIYAGHYGNWEMLTSLLLFSKYPNFMAFYQPLSNSYFERLMLKIRSRFGMVCVPSNQGYKKIRKFEQDKTCSIVYLIGDQCPTIHSSMYWTTFLSQDTAFLKGAETISKKMHIPIVFPYITKPKRGHYEITFKPIENIPQNKEHILQEYAKILEKNIKEEPRYWLWTHRRWKIKRK